MISADVTQGCVTGHSLRRIEKKKLAESGFAHLK